MRSVTLKDVEQDKVVKTVAAFLKKTGKVKVPEHMDLVKTGRFKELAPYDPDWFYVRCAAVLRHIYIRSPVGVKTVTKIFGGRQRNGVTPSHFCRSSGSIARKALQALEALKLVEKNPEGRILTMQGRRDLDRIAAQVRLKAKQAAKQSVIVLSSGSIARKALQALEALKLVEKNPEGRILTMQGRRDLDRIAAQVRLKAKQAAKQSVIVLSSGSIARKALQALEALKLVEKNPEGRILTMQGRRDLDRIAAQVRLKAKQAAKQSVIVL